MNREIYDNYIIQVVRNGSITAAAKSLGISQPALSSGITALEKDLGFKLLFRKSVPVSLTPEGEIYYAYINRQRVLTADLNRRIENYRSSTDDRFTIAAPSVYADSLLPKAIAAMKERKPECVISVKSGDMDEMIRMCSEGEVNCFISTSDVLPDNLEKRKIFEEHICLCVRRDSELFRKYSYGLGIANLNGEDFIFLEDGQPLRQTADMLFEKAGIVPKHSITVNQVSTALRLVSAGLGVCLAAEETVSDSSAIAAIRLDVPARSIYVAYDRDMFLPASCRDFMELLDRI